MMEYMSGVQTLTIDYNVFGTAESEGHYNMMTGSCTASTTHITNNTFNVKVNDADGELMSLGGLGNENNSVYYHITGNTFTTYGAAPIGFKIKNVNTYCYINDIKAVAANKEAIAASLNSNTGLASGTEIGGTSYFGKK